MSYDPLSFFRNAVARLSEAPAETIRCDRSRQPVRPSMAVAAAFGATMATVGLLSMPAQASPAPSSATSTIPSASVAEQVHGGASVEAVEAVLRSTVLSAAAREVASFGSTSGTPTHAARDYSAGTPRTMLEGALGTAAGREIQKRLEGDMFLGAEPVGLTRSETGVTISMSGRNGGYAVTIIQAGARDMLVRHDGDGRPHSPNPVLPAVEANFGGTEPLKVHAIHGNLASAQEVQDDFDYGAQSRVAFR